MTIYLTSSYEKTFACNQITTHKTYYNVAMNGHGPCQITTGLSINSALLLKEKSLEYSRIFLQKFHWFYKNQDALLLKEIEFTPSFVNVFVERKYHGKVKLLSNFIIERWITCYMFSHNWLKKIGTPYHIMTNENEAFCECYF